MCARSAQSRDRGPKSLVSLSSVALLQRSLIWILRALEVEAHGIRENGRIPGCGAESRTSTRDRCNFIRRKPARRRVRTRLPTDLHGASGTTSTACPYRNDPYVKRSL